MTHVEVVVVGAGPAGLCAATEAARGGADVLVIDDNTRAGGQIFRQRAPGFPDEANVPAGDVRRSAASLFAEAVSAGVRFALETTAWGSFEPRCLELSSGGKVDRVSADCLVIATGATDRTVPIRGWTLPGVFTVGGAQALLKGQGLLAGRRVMVAGVGPLPLVVASQLHEAGAKVVAVVEPVPRHRMLQVLPALLRAPQLLRAGIGYRLLLLKGRVPWLSSSMVTSIEGDERVERATVQRVDASWRPAGGTQTFAVDAVCLGYGLVPSLELARLCGCALTFSSESNNWVPARNAVLESTVSGIFIAGDCAGIAGAVVAAEEGRLVGLSVLERLGRLSVTEAEQRRAPHAARRERLEQVRRAFDRAYALDPALYDLATPDTIACRCEDVALADLEAAVTDGAVTMRQMRAYTRCGMGSCQGRMCGDAIRAWLATRTGCSLERMELPPAGVPTKPIVTLGALAAD